MFWQKDNDGLAARIKTVSGLYFSTLVMNFQFYQSFLLVKFSAIQYHHPPISNITLEKFNGHTLSIPSSDPVTQNASCITMALMDVAVGLLGNSCHTLLT